MTNKSVQKLVNLIVSQNPQDGWIFADMKDKDSEVNQLLDQLALNMILKNLNEKKYQQFINLLENQDNPGQAWLFVRKNIRNFEKRLASEFKAQLNQCKEDYDPGSKNSNDPGSGVSDGVKI